MHKEDTVNSQPQSAQQKADVMAEALAQPGAQDLLATARLARLAYNGLDGLPRVIPIGFHWNGGQIVVCGAPISPKVRAMAARPQVALTIDTDGETGPRSLLLRGTAATDIVDGVPGEHIAASTKGLDGEQASQVEAGMRAMYRQMARTVITPQWARYYDFAAGRMPGFLQELAAGASGSAQ
jgi:hypothetical protein